jgi:TorA maturation chaperone TorD
MDKALLHDWRQAVSQDLTVLALLHHEEVSAAQLDALRHNQFPYSLGLSLSESRSQDCCQLMHTALSELPTPITPEVLDELAADFAAIYLTHKYHASPCESVWLDEEGLMRQAPMFEIRQWYQRYELSIADWRHRPEDHLVYQLQFISHLLKLDDEPATLQTCAQFLDDHLLQWLHSFAQRVAQYAETAYYAALALLTQAYITELRALLALITAQESLAA